MTKAVIERVLEAEMATHLGYEEHDLAVKPGGDDRTGRGRRTLKGEFGEVEIATPVDRRATSEDGTSGRGRFRWPVGQQGPVDVRV